MYFQPFFWNLSLQQGPSASNVCVQRISNFVPVGGYVIFSVFFSFEAQLGSGLCITKAVHVEYDRSVGTRNHSSHFVHAQDTERREIFWRRYVGNSWIFLPSKWFAVSNSRYRRGIRTIQWRRQESNSTSYYVSLDGANDQPRSRDTVDRDRDKLHQMERGEMRGAFDTRLRLSTFSSKICCAKLLLAKLIDGPTGFDTKICLLMWKQTVLQRSLIICMFNPFQRLH